MSEDQTTIAEKLTSIYEEVKSIPKSGYSDYGDYSYFTEPDLFETLRPLFSEHGLAVIPSVENQDVTVLENGKFLTTVTMEWTIIDSDNGAQITLKSQGQGYDSTDKGGYAAITGATKYFLAKLALATTGDDPDAAVHDDVPSNNNSQSSGKAATEGQADFLADLIWELDEEDFDKVLSKLEEASGLAPETISGSRDEIEEIIMELVPIDVASNFIDKLKG